MNNLIIPNFTINDGVVNEGLSLINVSKLWKNAITGEGTYVAVIDTGCLIEHDELKENIIDKYNFTTDDNSNINTVTDYLGHGTHTAGIIASQNKKSTIGVAPDAKLIILKVINKSGIGTYKNLIKAINYAINWRGKNNEKINVINISLGGSNEDPDLRKAITNAIEKNISIVAAAGNSGDGLENTNEILYPAFYNDVIQVAATDHNMVPTNFSNTNVNIDFLAPGKDIYSTYIDGKFKRMSGTSMAAPHVTGIITLVNELFHLNNIMLTQKNIYKYLSYHSRFLDNYTSKTQGNGFLQL